MMPFLDCQLQVLNAYAGLKNTPMLAYSWIMMMMTLQMVMAKLKTLFAVWTKNDILKLYFLDHDFRSSNVRVNEVGYNLNVSGERNEESFTNSQPIEVEFNCDGVVPNNFNGYALALTNELVNIGSDGRRHFDLIQVQILNFFITILFLFIANCVIFKKAPLDLSGRMSMRQLGIVSLTITVISKILYDQLVVTFVEKRLFKSVVLTRSAISNFGSFFSSVY